MPAAAARQLAPLTPLEQLSYAREIVRLEAHALERLAGRIDARFGRAVELLHDCRGLVIVSGMGKAGLIGQKISATLASTGTRSLFLHPAEAVHGDLGRVSSDDCVLLLSQSGETDEVTRLLPTLQSLRVPIVAITGRETSTLGQASTVALELGPLQEACPLGLAPSTSTTAMLALGDALALVVSRMREFGRADFARLHPAGSLGRRLSRVDEVMRPLAQCRVAAQHDTIRAILATLQRPGRRTGAIMLVDDSGQLAGLFTDSDLARLFEARRDDALDRPVAEVMTVRPITVECGSMLLDAVTILAQRKISELPVVDASGRPLGLLDITDVVGVKTEEGEWGVGSGQ